MREYKFRGKEVDTGKWVYGGLFKEPAPPQCFEKTLEDKYWIVYPDPRYMPDWNLPYKIVRTDVDKETVGQYTGLKDKNGKEIFEGDIILTQPFRDKPYSKKYKGKRLKGIVKYNVKCGDDFYGCEGKMKYWGAEWCVEIIDKEDYKKFSNYDWGRFFECEVIGNIYDNPELLEEGE